MTAQQDATIKSCGRCGQQVREEPSQEQPEAGLALVSWSGHDSGKPAQGAEGGWPFPVSGARQFKGSAVLCCGCSRAFRVFMEAPASQESHAKLQDASASGDGRANFVRPSGEGIAEKMRQVREETERLARTREKRQVAFPVDMDPEEIRKHWLSGTTCACKPKDVREVMFFNDTHIVMKHRSHAEYVDRGSGSRTCNAYARLYLRAELAGALATNGGWRLNPIKEWTGRVNPRVVREECAALGVEFQQ